MIGKKILYWLATRWPSPVKQNDVVLGIDPEADSYHLNYAMKFQYEPRVKQGVGLEIENKDVLEIGCGHGGIAVFFGVNGARRVVGLDLNTDHLRIAELFKTAIARRLKTEALPVEFIEMNATKLEFADNSFDLIVADNVFEHFMEPEKVMSECFRVLRPGGLVSIASMPSYYSKHGLHLKNGIKMPWANLFFTEQTICDVMVKLSANNPKIKSIYPGVLDNPRRVRDLRKYKDLNGMTYRRLKTMARNTGFKQKSFGITPAPRVIGHLVQKISFLRNTIIGDIFSNKASAVFEK